jgi:bla regulator protein BlaR1
MNPAYLRPVADHLWQSTVFAGVVGLLTLALRRNSARTRHWMWLIASCKFLIPLSVLMALGGQLAWRTAPPSTHPGLSAVIQEVSQPFTSAAVLAPRLPPVAPARNWFPAVLLAIWACGFVGIAISWWIRWWRIRAAVRAGSPIQLAIPIPARSSPTLLEPGVFGIFRQVLLLPEGISERLTPTQLQAVVAHELCHTRYRDNLSAAIHMFVETVFWFHPLVWWIGNRMVSERERACDEEVLLLGAEPYVYAESILNICKLYVESPLVCVSGVTGSTLKPRIQAILANRKADSLSFAKKAAMAIIGAAALALPLAIGILNARAAHAQSPQASTPSARNLEFEVASIKLVPLPRDGRLTIGTRFEPGRFVGDYVTMQDCIAAAYNVRGGETIIGPAWTTDRGATAYSINAKAAGLASANDLRIMLQNLLASRFGLKLHVEDRPAQVYALTLIGKSIKLTPVKFDGPDPNAGAIHISASGAEFQHTSMTLLAWYLSGDPLGKVEDATGIHELFDFKLRFSSRFGRPFLDPAASLSRPGEGPPGDSDLPSIFDALKAIGLKLERRPGTVKAYVVDQVERIPTEN